ncbi:MAG: glucose-1-phosphate thymidylyltransferase [Bdellovibrionota bacterium]
MNKVTIESSFVKNESLFELKKATELQISSQLLQFLIDTEVPWAALGKSLTQFVENCVNAIPKEMRFAGSISPQAFLEKEESIVICKGAIVEAGAFISGPCFIEAGAIIRHGAYVRGSVYVGTQAVVGHTTECKGSILLPHAKAAHFNYVGDSILGHDCNLGAGTKLANLKINHGIVNLRIDGKKVDTGLKKFGAILGNRAQTGCNSVTNPGTIMLPEAVLLPNQTALGILRR